MHTQLMCCGGVVGEARNGPRQRKEAPACRLAADRYPGTSLPLPPSPGPGTSGWAELGPHPGPSDHGWIVGDRTRLRSSFLQVKEKGDFFPLSPACPGAAVGGEGWLLHAWWWAGGSRGVGSSPLPHAFALKRPSPHRCPGGDKMCPPRSSLWRSFSPSATSQHPFSPSLSSVPAAFLPLLSLHLSVCLSVCLQDPIPLRKARPSPLFPEMATSPLLSSLQEQSQNSSLNAETGHHFISGLEWEIGAWDERIE